MERNKLYFARSKLDRNVEEEATLLHNYEGRALAQSKELLERFRGLKTEALEYADTGPARQEWLALWEEGAVLIEGIADFSDVTANYTPQPAVQLSVLDLFFFRYLNRRYLGL
jgi:hypothetical protein